MFELLIVTILFGIICMGSLATVVYMLQRVASKKHKEELFKIDLKGGGLMNVVLGLFISPVYWVLQVLIIAAFCLLLLGLSMDYAGYNETEALLTFIAAGFISLSAAALYAMVIWLLDYKDREPIRLFPTLFLWGCMSAILAFFINTIIAVFFYEIFDEVVVMILVTAVVAPIVEEILKGGGLFVVSRNKLFSGIMDGIVYGFIIGMGFAFIEDWAYYTQYTPMDLGIVEWIQFILLRSILTGAAHGILTATTGIFLGIAVIKKSKSTRFWLAAGLISSIILHGTFNSLAILDSVIHAALGVDIPLVMGFMLLLIAGVALMIQRGLDEPPRKIEKK